MYKQIIDKIKPNLEKAIAYFKEELAALRTGRATPALIENIEVDFHRILIRLTSLNHLTILIHLNRHNLNYHNLSHD